MAFSPSMSGNLVKLYFEGVARTLMGNALFAAFSLERKSVTAKAIKYVDINGAVGNRVVTVPSGLKII